jgi:glycosyltransferase involved in cell wall biosynthesis
MGDAISTSLIEAMSVGSFPIQSNTSCANEWITDGETGIIVPPEDPEIIELAIRKAISDDNLVDNAAIVNRIKVRTEIDYHKLKSMTIQTYLKLFNTKKR